MTYVYYFYIYILRNELTALMVLSKLCEAQNFGGNTKSHAAESQHHAYAIHRGSVLSTLSSCYLAQSTSTYIATTNCAVARLHCLRLAPWTHTLGCHQYTQSFTHCRPYSTTAGKSSTHNPRVSWMARLSRSPGICAALPRQARRITWLSRELKVTALAHSKHWPTNSSVTTSLS